ncbi:hypothetical protein [Clostridium sp.]|uniref:hypothetical protein n=1 Tax=Clostridium sp. TaxID=1506 RepID=UPI0034646772
MNFFYPDDLDEFNGVRFFREYEGDVGEYEIEVSNPNKQNFHMMNNRARGFMPPRPPSGRPPDQTPPGGMTPGQMPPGGMAPGQMPPGGMAPGQMPPGGMAPGQMSPGGMTPGGSSSQAPQSPPPPFTPTKTQSGVKSMGPGAKAIDTGSIRPCLYRYTYIWQSNGRGYWAYLTYVGPKSIAGWRWMGWRWVYFGLDLNRIDSFYCV